MALWGNNDALGAGGTVSLNYSTRVVTGTGTTFGETGAVGAGDIIRFGYRGDGGTFFGDAIVVSVASTISCTIASTDGLSGAAIAGTTFYGSQLPKYTTWDRSFSRTLTTAPSQVNVFHSTISPNAAAGSTTIIPLNTFASGDIQVGDNFEGTLTNGGISITAVGSTTITLSAGIGAANTEAVGSAVTITRLTDGYDKLAYGLEAASLSLVGEPAAYEASDVGWVGVTTYIDNTGALRVKRECLVAMSGITTGDPAYPTPQG